MGRGRLAPPIKDNDWGSVRRAIARLSTVVLGSESTPTFAGLTLGNTGLHLLDTDASHDLIVKPGSDLTADRILTLTTGDSDRTITLQGNPTLDDWFDQSVKIDTYPRFLNTNSALSSMILTGGEISAGTNAGTIKVAALTAMLRTDTGALDPLTKIILAEQDNITLAAADTFYNVLLTYGDPCTIATSASGGNGANIIGIGHCLKEADGTRHYADAGLRLTDGVRKLHRRASRLRKIERSSGGLVASTGTRNFTITSAYFHRGINEYAFTSKDTSDTDKFDYYYYNPTAPAAWVKDDNTGSHYTALDNVQYNKVDSGTGLANLTANKYTTNWIFVHPDDEHVIVVYGRSNGTLTTAQNENIPPSLPDVIDDLAVLLCKVIIQQGSDTLVVQNVEYFVFSPDITVDHNELSGLQGGTTNEYYHLTSAEHTAVGSLGGTYQPLDDVLTDISALAVVADNEFIVGTGAGVLAWESGATARTSIGLGASDDVVFGTIASGAVTISGSSSGAYEALHIINTYPETDVSGYLKLGAGGGFGMISETGHVLNTPATDYSLVINTAGSSLLFHTDGQGCIGAAEGDNRNRPHSVYVANNVYAAQFTSNATGGSAAEPLLGYDYGVSGSSGINFTAPAITNMNISIADVHKASFSTTAFTLTSNYNLILSGTGAVNVGSMILADNLLTLNTGLTIESFASGFKFKRDGGNCRLNLDNGTESGTVFELPVTVATSVNAVPGAAYDWSFFVNSIDTENKEVQVYGYPDGLSKKYGSFQMVNVGGSPYFQIATDASGIYIPEAVQITGGIELIVPTGSAEIKINSADDVAILRMDSGPDTNASLLFFEDGNFRWGFTNDGDAGDLFILEAPAGAHLTVGQDGKIGMGTALTTPNAKVHIKQSSLSAAIPVLELEQADIDDTFINFNGTSAVNGSRSISSDITEDSTKFGAIRVEINGVQKWIRIYNDES